MTKRCKNCGWPNDDSKMRCEKCSAPLEEGQSSRPISQQTFSESMVDRGENLRRTISESQFVDREEAPASYEAEVQEPSAGGSCPNCGYPVRGGMNVCPDCGTPLSITRATSHGTVNPWMQPDRGAYCTLKPIAWQGENVEHQPLSFSGESIILNRANTDPNNQSITSAEQAALTFEDGEWYIVDKSAQHTTYVLAAQKTKLHKGDIVVLGNRLFEFN